MNKADELKLMADLAKKLGNDSYCGPALVQLLPYIESQMRADFPVDLLGQFKGMIDGTVALEAAYQAKRKEVAELEAKAARLKMDQANAAFKLEKVLETLDNVNNQLTMVARGLNKGE